MRTITAIAKYSDEEIKKLEGYFIKDHHYDQVIDYDCDEDFDEKMFQKEISKLSGKNRRIRKKTKKPKQIENILLPYLLMSILNPQKKENVFVGQNWPSHA